MPEAIQRVFRSSEQKQHIDAFNFSKVYFRMYLFSVCVFVIFGVWIELLPPVLRLSEVSHH